MCWVVIYMTHLLIDWKDQPNALKEQNFNNRGLLPTESEHGKIGSPERANQA
jgi:hypothetical protein